jgi:hypothetical protein
MPRRTDPRTQSTQTSPSSPARLPSVTRPPAAPRRPRPFVPRGPSQGPSSLVPPARPSVSRVAALVRGGSVLGAVRCGCAAVPVSGRGPGPALPNFFVHTNVHTAGQQGPLTTSTRSDQSCRRQGRPCRGGRRVGRPALKASRSSGAGLGSQSRQMLKSSHDFDSESSWLPK